MLPAAAPCGPCLHDQASMLLAHGCKCMRLLMEGGSRDNFVVSRVEGQIGLSLAPLWHPPAVLPGDALESDEDLADELLCGFEEGATRIK